MKTVCKINKCVGCYACKDMCPKAAIEIIDDAEHFNAVIDINKCIDCKICERVCQVNQPIEKQNPVEWFQGYSKNDTIRKTSSSGGLAAELSRQIIIDGGMVCSCIFEGGRFCFKFAESMDELKAFAGSKYVKSNPSGMYKAVKEQLGKGRIVLFIGLPCQCAAVKKVIGKADKGQLYTVDLICHGTPSPQILNSFLNQYECGLEQLETIRFRDKGRFSLETHEKHIVTSGTMDCYSIAFLNGLVYTENCYECVYADSKRVTDITIGDSWGTELPDAAKGISLVLCNTEQGKGLVESANVYLTDVNIENAIASNPQLKLATVMPIKRTDFFSGYKKGEKINRLVMRCCTKKWFRQFVKRQLIRAKIIRGGGQTYSIFYGKKMIDGER